MDGCSELPFDSSDEIDVSNSISNSSGDDRLGLDRAIARVFLNGLKLFHCIHAGDNLTEDGVAHMEPRRCRSGDEKLASIRARSGIGHGKQAGTVESHGGIALVLEGLPPDRVASTTAPGGIAALNHKVVDDAVENDAVVITVLHMCSEIFAGFGRNLVIEFEFETALGGFEDD